MKTEILKSILEHLNFGFAFLSPSFTINDCNSIFLDFVHPNNNVNGTTVFDIIPEAVGLDNEFPKIELILL